MNPASQSPSGSPKGGPRQLAPAALGYKRHSRHTALMRSAPKAAHFLLFLKNPQFWVIGGIVSGVFLSLLWFVKDLPALPRTNLTAIRILEEWKRRRLTVSEQPPVMENGKVVAPAEKHYTVTTEFVERPQGR